MGRFTTESTEHTEEREDLMEQDPIMGRVSGLLINLNVWRLADGIEQFKL